MAEHVARQAEGLAVGDLAPESEVAAVLAGVVEHVAREAEALAIGDSAPEAETCSRSMREMSTP